MITLKYLSEEIANNYKTMDQDHNRPQAERAETKLLMTLLNDIVDHEAKITKTDMIDLLKYFLDNKKFT